MDIAKTPGIFTLDKVAAKRRRGAACSPFRMAISSERKECFKRSQKEAENEKSEKAIVTAGCGARNPPLRAA